MWEKILSRLNLNRQKILFNSGWLYQEKLLRMLMALFLTAWVARYLGPEGFGRLSYAFSFVALFESVATLGLPSIVKREVLLHNHEKNEYLGTGFWLTFLASGLCMILIGVVSSLLHADDKVLHFMILISSLLLLLKSFDMIEFWYESQLQSKTIVFSKTISLLLVAGIKIALIHYHYQAFAFVWAQVLEMFLYVLGLVLAYRSMSAWKFSWPLARKMLRDSWPLIFSGITVVIYMKIDQFMLKSYIGDQAVGLYSAAIRLSEIWYFIPVIVTSSVFPIMIESRKKDEQDFAKKMEKLYFLMTYLFLFISIPLTFLAPTLIELIFAKGYFSSIEILQVHIWSALFVFWGVIQGIWDVALNLTHFAFIRSVVGSLVNIGLNMILIPKYAGLGAAWATVISYGTTNCAMNLFYAKTRKIFYFQMKSFLFYKFLPEFLKGKTP